MISEVLFSLFLSSSWMPSIADCRTALRDYYERLYNEIIYVAKTGDTRNLYKFGQIDSAEIREELQNEISRRGINAVIAELEKNLKEILLKIKNVEIKIIGEEGSYFRVYNNSNSDSIDVGVCRASNPPGLYLFSIHTYSPEIERKIGDYTKEELFYQENQPEERQEQKQEEPIVYDVGEWAPITDNLELRVNEAYKKRIWYSEIWQAAGLTFDGLSERDLEEINQRYVDALIVNVTARGKTTEEASIDLDWINIVYPYSCPPFTENSGLLKIINGTDRITRKVTEYTSATFDVPYIIYTNIKGDFDEGIKVPEGILRIGTTLNSDVQIEIGRFNR